MSIGLYDEIVNIFKEGLTQRKAQELGKDDLEFLKKQTGLTEEQINNVFAEYKQTDKNGNSTLTKTEFENLYIKLNGLSPNESTNKIDYIFDAFDKDKNGTLSFSEFLAKEMFLNEKDEIKTVLKGILIFMDAGNQSDKIAEECMSQLDIDRNGKVTKKEFIDCVSKNSKVKSFMSIV